MSEFRAAVRRAVARLDPRGEEEQHEDAVQERRVCYQPAEHAMAWINSYLPAGDGQAVLTAVRQPNMRFVAVKTVAQQELLMLHRVRQRLVVERTAKANLIRRQEETAATRSLLNTAKLMEDNKLLLRLKELESLEKLVEKVGRIDLHASNGQGLEAILKSLFRLDSDKAA